MTGDNVIKIEFEKTFGQGVDPWQDKVERWVKKKFKNPFIQHLALGFIEWLKQKWIDVKVANTMRDIDAQAENIQKIWEEEDKPKTIITTTPSEVEGLDDIEIEYNKYYHGSSSQRKHYGCDTSCWGIVYNICYTEVCLR